MGEAYLISICGKIYFVVYIGYKKGAKGCVYHVEVLFPLVIIQSQACCVGFG